MKKYTILLSILLSSCSYSYTPDARSPALSADEHIKEINYKNLKKGKACSNFFGLGDYSVSNAAEKGNVKTILFVEKQIENVFIFIKKCTIVKGL